MELVNGQISYNAITPKHLNDILRGTVPADGQWHDFTARVCFVDGKLYVHSATAVQNETPLDAGMRVSAGENAPVVDEEESLKRFKNKAWRWNRAADC